MEFELGLELELELEPNKTKLSLSSIKRATKELKKAGKTEMSMCGAMRDWARFGLIHPSQAASGKLVLANAMVLRTADIASLKINICG